MMDIQSFLTLYGKPKEYSYEFECVERWLDENILPQMIEVAQSNESSLDFVVETELINPSIVRKVFEAKGYKTLWWPVVDRPGQPVKQMKIEVFWGKE